MKNQIKAVRVSKGITQKELAHRLGVKPPTVAQFEKSEKVRFETLERIADALDCSVYELQGAPNFADTFYDEDKEKLLYRFSKLNKTGRSMAIEIVTTLTKNKDLLDERKNASRESSLKHQ